MRYAKKRKGKIVHAWELGAGSEMERLLMEEGALLRQPDGRYRLFSLEAVNGIGELAEPGDYFKVDEVEGRHYPCPNAREWFIRNHRPLGADTYEQLVRPLPVWTREDGPCDVVDWLIESGRLRIDPDDPARYYSAVLWNAPLSAAADAVLVFHGIDRDGNGLIRDVSFSFVKRDIFERDYVPCDEAD